MRVAERERVLAPLLAACTALGVARASVYRRQRPPRARVVRERPPSPRRLSDVERTTVIDVLHSQEFADQPPSEAYATLLGRGTYHASIRTMYRLLASLGESRERRCQRARAAYSKPSLTASAPNEVWTWDITKLAGPCAGIFYCLYVVLDLFSRYVVAWMIAETESRHLAAQLFTDAITRTGVEPGELVVHSDRGPTMKSRGLAQVLANLGVARSFSRPRVSDDNPFSEAQFKTLKYQPDYPGRFGSLEHGRGWCQQFFGWHNDEHHHSGLALFTPADVFFGRVAVVSAERQRALDDAYAAHPERFTRGRPLVRLPPTSVTINPIILPTNDSREHSVIGDLDFPLRS